MLELKLNPPAARPGLVRRNRLLDRLREISHTKLVVFSAPAGYGKTTAMAQWREALPGPTAWLTLDSSDSDPVPLLDHLSTSLEGAGMVSSASGGRLASGDILTLGVDRLLGRMESAAIGGWLLLDQVEQVGTRESMDVLASLLVRLPAGFHAALTTRSGRTLPLALLRARGEIAEFGPTDLAMDEVEAKELLAGTGVDLDEGLELLVQKTEGWPAGLYLAALAMRTEGSPSVADISGRDYYIADYVRDELLPTIPEERMSFLTGTSVLPAMSGPLCDHVLETTGSGEILEELERDNLLVVPLDRDRTWFRYHSLIKDFFLERLRQSDPGRLTRLHSRAATWHEARDELDLAIAHAMEAEDVERVGAWVVRASRPTYSVGRIDTILSWFTWLQRHHWMDDHPEVAALGSFSHVLEGDSAGADLLAEFASGDNGEGLGPYQLLIRSLRFEKGPEAAASDARAAQHMLEPGSDWLHVFLGAEAMALMCGGHIEDSERLWQDAAARASAFDAFPLWSYALSQLAQFALDRGDLDDAERLKSEALAMVDSAGIETYITSGLAYVIASRLAVRSGEMDTAVSLMARAAMTRPRLSVAAPAMATQVLLEQVRAYVEMADMAGARRVLREARDMLVRRPRLGILRDRYDEIEQRLSELPTGSVGPSSLTAAELRLLPMLVTHLTYPEIGDRLFVSRHTVKTQAMSIYRKLGVSSRGEAVEMAREVGLLSV